MSDLSIVGSLIGTGGSSGGGSSTPTQNTGDTSDTSDTTTVSPTAEGSDTGSTGSGTTGDGTSGGGSSDSAAASGGTRATSPGGSDRVAGAQGASRPADRVEADQSLEQLRARAADPTGGFGSAVSAIEQVFGIDPSRTFAVLFEQPADPPADGELSDRFLSALYTVRADDDAGGLGAVPDSPTLTLLTQGNTGDGGAGAPPKPDGATDLRA